MNSYESVYNSFTNMDYNKNGLIDVNSFKNIIKQYNFDKNQID